MNKEKRIASILEAVEVKKIYCSYSYRHDQLVSSARPKIEVIFEKMAEDLSAEIMASIKSSDISQHYEGVGFTVVAMSEAGFKSLLDKVYQAGFEHRLTEIDRSWGENENV